MKNFTRQEVKNKLIKENADTLLQLMKLDIKYLHNLLQNGLKGYKTYSNHDLEKEYKEVFKKDVRII